MASCCGQSCQSSGAHQGADQRLLLLLLTVRGYPEALDHHQQQQPPQPTGQHDYKQCKHLLRLLSVPPYQPAEQQQHQQQEQGPTCTLGRHPLQQLLVLLQLPLSSHLRLKQLQQQQQRAHWSGKQQMGSGNAPMNCHWCCAPLLGRQAGRGRLQHWPDCLRA